MTEAGTRMQPGNPPILTLDNLKVSFTTPDGDVEAVRGINCQVYPGECTGIVGESGSGKSQTFLAALGLLATNGRVSGSARLAEKELLHLPLADLNTIRGKRISMIFQDPLTSLTPHLQIGEQMQEVLLTHRPGESVRSGRKPHHQTRHQARRHARDVCLHWLERVHIPEPARRLQQYPHELSGGMRQRVMIAMAMLCEPEVLIADEPTTALDVTIQAEILDLMQELQHEHNTAIVFITHDMGVVARMCQQVLVMEKGLVVESGPVEQIFYSPVHPYTRMLLDSVPIINQDQVSGEAPDSDELLSVDGVSVQFAMPGKFLRARRKLTAVDDISFSLYRGETLGIVGESGSGKSTLARAILQLLPSQQGTISWLGDSISALDKNALKQMRQHMQIVFQDPLASLNPAMPIGESIREPLRVFRSQLSRTDMNRQVAQMMERVGLSGALINRYPHELSGGQNQRVGIARAMILKPELIICDEAVSALDVSIQSQVLDLLQSLQDEFQLTCIFISHDLSVVWEISHRILVMYAGGIVELAPRDVLFRQPHHPYTRQLISAVPLPDPVREAERQRLIFRHDLPGPADPLARLRFMPEMLARNPTYRPELQQISDQHLVAEYEPLETLVAR